MEAQQSEYEMVTYTYQPSRFYPKDYIFPPVSRVPSDVPNSEYSEKAFEDPERRTDFDMDYPSDAADPGDDPELEIRPVTKTVDSSTDTSLNTIDTMSTIFHTPQNEICYLQVLLSGATRIVRKPGILPIVCYTDSSTSTSKVEDAPTANAREAGERLEDLISRLEVEKKRKSISRSPENDIDDFSMEG